MTKEDKDARQRVLAATVDLIEEKGVPRLTVREIARKAGVNIAAISYYFGSKEKLLDAVLAFTLDNAFTDPLAEIRARKLTADQALRLVLADWLQGIVNYPGITRVHVMGHHLNRKQHARSVKRFHSFLKALAGHLQELNPGNDPSALRRTIAQTVSAVLLPAMIPEMFDDFLNTDLTTEAGRDIYLNHLLGSSGAGRS